MTHINPQVKKAYKEWQQAKTDYANGVEDVDDPSKLFRQYSRILHRTYTTHKDIRDIMTALKAH